MNHDEAARLWRTEEPVLRRRAARLLRDDHLAEDVVQEAFVRLLALPEPPDAPGAWLNVVVGRICVDRLRSASSRHEVAGTAPEGLAPDPADRVTLDDQVRGALGVILDRLSPAERVGYLLHDVFRLPFAEIAAITGAEAPTVRQQVSRARRRLAAHDPLESPRAEESVVERFLAACRTGDLAALVEVLAPDAWGVARFADGAPEVVGRGAAEVAAGLLRFLGPPVVLVDRGTTVQAFVGLRWFAAVDLDLADDRIRSVAALVEPPPADPAA